MKKSELETIIKKIQNRCYLEDPTKITYYWNKEHKVVFKIFFDSLYLPANLRIDEDKLQNTFIQQNVYEFEDDFEILGLNLDEGYIKVLPDNQNFKVVNNYREANKPETKEESVIVHLASRNLKEFFARSKNYILQEADEIPTESDKIDKTVEKETQKEPEDANIFVVATAFTLSDSAIGKNGIINKALNEVINHVNEKDTKSKVIFSIPKVISGTPATDLISIKNFNKQVNDLIGGDTFAYFGGKGNQNTADMLNSVKVKNVYFLTDSAEDAIKNANLPKLLSGNIKSDIKEIPDTSRNDLLNAQKVADKLIDGYRKQIKSKGGVRADSSKTKLGLGSKLSISVWDKRRTFLEKNSNKRVNAAITFCEDLYGQNADSLDKAYYEERKEKAHRSLNKVKNIGNEEETNNWFGEFVEFIKNASVILADKFKNAVASLSNVQSTSTVKASGGGVFSHQDMGGGTAGLSRKKDNTRKEIKVKKGESKVSDYLGDFPIFIATNKDGTDWNSTFKSLLEFFSENLCDSQSLVTPLEPLDSESENEDENDEDKDKDKETEEDTTEEEENDNNDQDSEEPADESNDEEVETD